jgi:hypothetical protein
MLIAVIVLAWLLANTWLSLLLVQIEGTSFSGWDEMLTLLLCAVFNPFVFLGVCFVIRWVIKMIKKSKKRNTEKIYFAEDFE